MKFARCEPGRVVEKKGKSIAIIGAGPAGLGAAGELVCMGYEVEVYDQMPEPGGLLIFGIPEFRVPKDRVRAGIKELEELGVVFHTNTRVDCAKLAEIVEGHDATLIATGTWKPRRLNIPGSNLPQVIDALGYIIDYHLAKFGYKSWDEIPRLSGRVAVIGGGLTAVDACYIARDMGADEIHLLYRRTRKQAPAGERELQHIESALGVKIHELVTPVEYKGKDRLEAVRLIKMRLEAPDASGRPRPVPIPGSEFDMEFDYVLEAIGLIPTPPFDGEECIGIKLTSKGTVETDDKYRTSRRGVFAAGDVRHGPWLIGPALKSGKESARFIDEYLRTGEWR